MKIIQKRKIDPDSARWVSSWTLWANALDATRRRYERVPDFTTLLPEDRPLLEGEKEER